MALSLGFFCWTGFAQHDDVAVFTARLAASRASFDYEFVLDDGKVKMKGEGNVVVQGSSYMTKGNGLDIWCDGTSRWTADTAAKELVIEPLESEQTVITDPAMLVGNLAREFTWSDSGIPGTIDGKPSKVYRLEPKSDDGISKAVLYFDSDGKTIIAADIFLAEGSVMTFTISSFLFAEPGDPSDFFPPVFSSDWIVTDLR